VLGYEVDCLWPDQRLIVELDGRATHVTARAFESDRARDAALTAAGYRVIRVTWRRLHGGQQRLAAQLATMLSTAA
jgi:very-short-patch-repair endonuclease